MFYFQPVSKLGELVRIFPIKNFPSCK